MNTSSPDFSVAKSGLQTPWENAVPMLSSFDLFVLPFLLGGA
jgi:hypothetical protein